VSGWIEDVVRWTGYWGVALLMAVENVFPPIPSEVVMPFAGYATTRNASLDIWGVIAAGTVGSLLGALVLYGLGRWIGDERLRRFAARHGRWLLLSVDDIDRAERWFERHGKLAVFACRLVPGLRSLISVPAGICGMSLVPFLAWSAAGSAIWTAGLAWAGRWLGSEYETIGIVLGPVASVVLGALVVSYLVAVWRWRPS